jgi:hypothetical protein
MGELRHVQVRSATRAAGSCALTPTARASQEDAEDLTPAVRAHNDALQAAGKPLLGASRSVRRSATRS